MYMFTSIHIRTSRHMRTVRCPLFCQLQHAASDLLARFFFCCQRLSATELSLAFVLSLPNLRPTSVGRPTLSLQWNIRVCARGCCVRRFTCNYTHIYTCIYIYIFIYTYPIHARIDIYAAVSTSFVRCTMRHQLCLRCSFFAIFIVGDFCGRRLAAPRYHLQSSCH
jgi:hypothetical protein